MGFKALVGSSLPVVRSFARCASIVCVTAACCLGAAVAFGQNNDTARAVEVLRSAQRDAARDAAGAYRDLRELIDGPLLQRLDSKAQHEALFLAGYLAFTLERLADAHTLLRRSSEHEHAAMADWNGRFLAAVQADEYADAVVVLKEIAARFPDGFRTLYSPAIYGALRAMREASRNDLVVEALEILFEGRWLAAGSQEPSVAWRDLALARLDRNDLPGAIQAASRIASPVVLIEMRADKRFDAIVAALPSHFDVDRAVGEEIASLKAAVEATPNLMEPIVLLVSALQRANRLEEALTLADATLERATDRNRLSPYTDGRAQLVWLRSARANVLWTMGRHAEAADELKQASDVPGNVSQRVNYAARLVALGRPADALPLVRDLEDTSAFGDMQAAAVELAAAVQLGNRRLASRALEYLQAHEEDAIDALQDGLLSVRNLDAAALLFIQRLKSIETRGDALVAAQHYLDAPQTQYEAQRAADWAALLDRADVRVALEDVGRIGSYAVNRP